MLGTQAFTDYIKHQQDFLKNRWAFFLESIADELTEVYKKGKGTIFEMFAKFSSNCLAWAADQDGLKFARSYCELVKLGKFFESHK